MTDKEALKLALEALDQSATTYFNKRDAAITAIKAALVTKDVSLPEQEPVACVYKAITKKGETAHFGEYSAASAWAGFGSVEQVPLKTLTLISKSIKPCTTCEALARTVMLDQTSHDTSPPQRQPLTHEQRIDLLIEFEPSKSNWNAESILIDMVEAKHGIGDKT